MDLKKLNVIIPIVSVGVMIVWGTVSGSYNNAWLAVFVGGIIMTIFNVMGKKTYRVTWRGSDARRSRSLP